MAGEASVASTASGVVWHTQVQRARLQLFSRHRTDRADVVDCLSHPRHRVGQVLIDPALQQGSRGIKRDQEGSRGIKRDQEGSRGIKRDQEGSRGIGADRSGAATGIKRDQEGSRGIKRDQEGQVLIHPALQQAGIKAA